MDRVEKIFHKFHKLDQTELCLDKRKTLKMSRSSREKYMLN